MPIKDRLELLFARSFFLVYKPMAAHGGCVVCATPESDLRCGAAVVSAASFGKCATHFAALPLAPGPVLVKLGEMLATALNWLDAAGVLYSLGDDTLEAAHGWGGFYPWVRRAVVWIPAPCFDALWRERRVLETATGCIATATGTPSNRRLMLQSPEHHAWRGSSPALVLCQPPAHAWISPDTLTRIPFGAGPGRSVLCVALAAEPRGWQAWDECSHADSSARYAVPFSSLATHLVSACALPAGRLFERADFFEAAPKVVADAVPEPKASALKRKREPPAPVGVPPEWAAAVAAAGLTLLSDEAGARALLRARQPGWVSVDYALKAAAGPLGVVTAGGAAAAVDVVWGTEGAACSGASGVQRAARFCGLVARRLDGAGAQRPALLYVTVLFAAAPARGAGRSLLSALLRIAETLGVWCVLEPASAALVRTYLTMELGLEILTPRPGELFLYKRYPCKGAPPRFVRAAKPALATHPFKAVAAQMAAVVAEERRFETAVAAAWAETFDCSSILERLAPALRRILVAFFTAWNLPSEDWAAWEVRALHLLRCDLCATSSDPALRTRLDDAALQRAHGLLHGGLP